MQDGQTRYFFDVQAGETVAADHHGVILASADEAARDAAAIAADTVARTPEIGRPVTVTVRAGGAALLRVRAALTLERVEPEHQGGATARQRVGGTP